jgi:hypothetical protein
MRNGNLVIGDSNGNISWFSPQGELLNNKSGASGIVLMTSDASKSLLVVAR